MVKIGRLPEKILKKPLYRIDTLERLFEILDNSQLTFVRPKRWSDPLENILFNAKTLKNGMPFEHPGKKNIYAQCWTYDNDNYGLWQIYRKDSIGVRMATHYSNLNQLTKLNNLPFYYGKVSYKRKYQLEKLIKDKNFIRPLAELNISQAHIKTLLVKRHSYYYEKEIRLFCVTEHDYVDQQDSDLVRLNIKPKYFFSSLRFDPAMNYNDFSKIRERLINDYGFRKTQISRSTLMIENRFKIKL